MIADLADVLFGCWHSNYSFPVTDRLRKNPASRVTGMYVVCLDCGKEFPYDWAQMKVVENSRQYDGQMLDRITEQVKAAELAGGVR